MSSGVKYDQGKPRVGLMISDFSRALNEVATVSTFGANKYSPSGWRTVEDARNRYWDALHRHLLAMSTADRDEESNLLHLAHAAWNALAVLEIELTIQSEEGR
jgi:hypothetical protein